MLACLATETFNTATLPNSETLRTRQKTRTTLVEDRWKGTKSYDIIGNKLPYKIPNIPSNARDNP
jgi:hypothetical protein